MAMREGAGVEVTYEVPLWSDRWVLWDDDNMPESAEHERVECLLRDILETWVDRTGRDAMAGGNIPGREGGGRTTHRRSA